MTRIVIRPEAEPTHVSDNRKILYVDQDDDHLKLIDAALTPTDLETGGGGGGGSSSSPRVYAIPFAFDTPDLLTGHVVYTPTVGDVLMDVWIEVDTPWDDRPSIQSASITGSPDGGTFSLNGRGPFAFNVNATTLEAAFDNPSVHVSGTNPDFLIEGFTGSLSVSDNSLTGGTSPDVVTGLVQSAGTPLADVGTFVGQSTGLSGIINDSPGGWPLDGLGFTELGGEGLLVGSGPSAAGDMELPLTGYQTANSEPILPGRFIATNPVKLVVTQDGTSGGADPGSTQGEAILYLVIATPETP